MEGKTTYFIIQILILSDTKVGEIFAQYDNW